MCDMLEFFIYTYLFSFLPLYSCIYKIKAARLPLLPFSAHFFTWSFHSFIQYVLNTCLIVTIGKFIGNEWNRQKYLPSPALYLPRTTKRKVWGLRLKREMVGGRIWGLYNDRYYTEGGRDCMVNRVVRKIYTKEAFMSGLEEVRTELWGWPHVTQEVSIGEWGHWGMKQRSQISQSRLCYRSGLWYLV